MISQCWDIVGPWVRFPAGHLDHTFALKGAHSRFRWATTHQTRTLFSEAFVAYSNDSPRRRLPANGLRTLAIFGSVFPQVTPQTNGWRTLKRTLRGGSVKTSGSATRLIDWFPFAV